MSDNNEERLSQIKQRLAANAYFVNPHSDANVAEDIGYLLALAAELEKKLETQRKKNDVLSNQMLELTQEIENTKADFGNNR